MKLHHFNQTFLGFFFLLLSSQLQAAQWYQVELIVFENLTTTTDEQWPIYDENSATQLTPQTSTSTKQYLSNVANSLARSSNYRVHYYEAWQQSISPIASAKPMSVQTEDGIIRGEIKLYKANYLYASVDLWLNTQSYAVRKPRLKESRRINSKKLYFFDHPKLGALLKLTPITLD